MRLSTPHTKQFALKYCIENRERGYRLSIEYNQTAVYLNVLSIEYNLSSLTWALNPVSDGGIENTQCALSSLCVICAAPRLSAAASAPPLYEVSSATRSLARRTWHLVASHCTSTCGSALILPTNPLHLQHPSAFDTGKGHVCRLLITVRWLSESCVYVCLDTHLPLTQRACRGGGGGGV